MLVGVPRFWRWKGGETAINCLQPPAAWHGDRAARTPLPKAASASPPWLARATERAASSQLRSGAVPRAPGAERGARAAAAAERLIGVGGARAAYLAAPGASLRPRCRAPAPAPAASSSAPSCCSRSKAGSGGASAPPPPAASLCRQPFVPGLFGSRLLAQNRRSALPRKCTRGSLEAEKEPPPSPLPL